MESQLAQPITPKTPVPQPGPPETPPVPPTKKISKILIIILVLLFLATTGVAGYFAYQNYQFKKQTPQPQPSLLPVATTIPTTRPAISPAPTLDPTANWKTYRSDAVGIEFKYPQNWYAIPFSEITFNVLLESHPFEIPEYPIITSIQIAFNEITNTTTNQKYLVEETLQQIIDETISGFEQDSVKTNSLTVNGRKAWQISGIMGPGFMGGGYQKATYIQIDKHILGIYLNNKEYEDIYDQILLTLKFTNKATPVFTCEKDEDCVLTSYTYTCCGASCGGVLINKQELEKRKEWKSANCTDEDYDKCPRVSCMLVNEKAVCQNSECVRITAE